MWNLKQSTAITWHFFVHDQYGNAVPSLVDGGFTKYIAKNGGALGSMTVTITEDAQGWYTIPISTAHTNTLGELVISFTHASAQQVNLQFMVTARTNDDFAYPTTSGRSMDVDASGGVEVGSFQANAITAAAIADGAIDAATFAAGAIDATAIADNAIDAGAIAANAITAAKIADAAIDAATFAADTNAYTAKLVVVDDDTGSADHYVAQWFKNGVPVTSGITSPTIEVVKAADGTDLIASTAMTQIASTGAYRYDATGGSRVVDGAIYFAVLGATIDSGARVWRQQVGRDS